MHRWRAAAGPVASVTILAVLAFGCSPGETPGAVAEAVNTAIPDQASVTVEPSHAPPTAANTPVAAGWPITIAAVGDIMLDRSVAYAITDERPDGPFVHVRNLLRGADLTVGNLECVLSEEGFPEPKSYTFRGPVAGAAGLAAAGFDLVTLANNHSLDFGPEALLETLELLRAASVEAVGAGADDNEAHGYRILDSGGVRVAFLGLAEVPDEAGYNMRAWTARPGEPGIAWAEDGRTTETVRAATGEADLVVVMYHFGLEGFLRPTERQRELARAAIDAGANLVIGSHPHVLQEVEEYGDGLIAYSLGNFVFDGFDGIANQSGILFVSFAADGALAWRIEPVAIGWDGLPRLVE